MRAIKIFGLSFILVMTFWSCKKIAIPDPGVKAVFGKWKYVRGYGGISGSIELQEEYNKSTWVEYKENGHYEVHNSWRIIHCEKYKFEDSHIIKYDKKTAQSFIVSNDTLFLWDDVCCNGPKYVFIKK